MSGASSVIFTFSFNEKVLLPIWLRYYSQHVDNVIVYDHGTTDGSIEWARAFGAEIRKLDSGRMFDYAYTNRRLKEEHRALLNHYRVVLYADVDEFIVCEAGLGEYVAAFENDRVYCNGYNVVQGDDPAIDWNHRLLPQRSGMVFDINYCKPLITTAPVDWVPGTHHDSREGLGGGARRDADLYLFHLKYADWAEYVRRTRNRFPDMPGVDVERAWNKAMGEMVPIPQSVRDAF